MQGFVEIQEAEEAEEIESIVGSGGKMSAKREREDYIGDLDVTRGLIARCITGSRTFRKTTIQPSCLNAVSPFHLLSSEPCTGPLAYQNDQGNNLPTSALFALPSSKISLMTNPVPGPCVIPQQLCPLATNTPGRAVGPIRGRPRSEMGRKQACSAIVCDFSEENSGVKAEAWVCRSSMLNGSGFT